MAASPICTFSGTKLLISNTNIRIKQKPALCKQNTLLFSSQQKISATSFNHYFNETWDFNVRQKNQNSLSCIQHSPKELPTQQPLSCQTFKQSGIIFSNTEPRTPDSYCHLNKCNQLWKLEMGVETVCRGSPQSYQAWLFSSTFMTLFHEIPTLQTTLFKKKKLNPSKCFNFSSFELNQNYVASPKKTNYLSLRLVCILYSQNNEFITNTKYLFSSP